MLSNSLALARISRLMAIASCLGALAFTLPAQGQFLRKKKSEEAGKKDEKKDKDAPKKLEKVVESTTAHEGLFTLYQDTVKGNSWFAIPDTLLDQPFIYFSHVSDGVAITGATRGTYRGSKVISFHRHYNRIEVHTINTNYFFDPAHPLFRAAEANINNPILASLKIEAVDSTETIFLVDGDALFLAEEFQMIKPPSQGSSKSALGKLSKEKTKIAAINNYPENTEITVDYVYDNRAPKGGGAAVEDPRFITVTYQHSILEMPEDSFTPRFDDQRVGYFGTQVEDMTSASSTPWRDMIHRWRLEKAHPDQAMSTPVKPITWWIENTTPHEFRDIIKEGVLKWNQAFEPLGFEGAVEVKVQPDSADWDAGDVRYNVLRWTSSPSPRYSGYGPSFVNPLTGEILGADIMLEWSGMVGRLWRSEVFSEAGMLSIETGVSGSRSEFSSRAAFAEQMHRCDAGNVQAQQTLFGMAALSARNFSDEEHEQFVRETLHRLVLHEVGHTLGLSHNMHGSTLHTPEELKDAEVVAATGLCNSVMDYPAINFPLDPADHTQFYDDKPGLYDKWVIDYGYSVALSDEASEADRLDQILSKSNDPRLAFGNDADDMRRPGGGMNPDVNIYDLSNEQVAYAVERCELVNALLPEIVAVYGGANATSFLEVRKAYLTLTGEYATQLGVMTRQIGGVRYDRSMASEQTAAPLTPINAADQRSAMAALARYAFAPDAFSSAEDVYGYLQQQRRGFGFWGAAEDPKIHDRVLNAQKRALAHLLHPVVLTRLTDAALYGNEYGLDALLGELTSAVFRSDLRTSVNSFRQQLQWAYTTELVKIATDEERYSSIARGMALATLARIDREQRSAAKPDSMTKAHREHLIFIIEKGLDTE